ncbi:hypothetical protein GCM10023158_34570 [Gluconacetobacter tumulicola]
MVPVAGQGGFIQDGHALGDHAIHGHDLAPAHQNPVSGHQVGEGDIPNLPVGMSGGISLHAVQQRRHFAPRPCLGKILQRLTARKHQGDDDAGQMRAENKRPGHGQDRRGSTDP